MSNNLTEEQLRNMGLIPNADGVYERQKVKPYKVQQDIILKRQRESLNMAIDKIKSSDNSTGYRIDVKPLSVNDIFTGMRRRTKEYNKYIRAVKKLLPPIVLPPPPFKIYLEFGQSSKGADFDAGIKAFVDIVSTFYEFNDNLIYEGVIKKIIVSKGSEYVRFNIESL